jgi:hypothetical protein
MNRGILAGIAVAGAALLTPLAHAEQFASAHTFIELRNLQLLRADGLPLAASDLSSFAPNYAASTLLRYGTREVAQSRSETSPVDLPKDCAGPTCPDVDENSFESYASPPLVHAFGDQQASGNLVGDPDGLTLRGRADASSSSVFDKAWGAWRSNTTNKVSIDFRLASAQTVRLAFSVRGWFWPERNIEATHARSAVAAAFEIVNTRDGTRWRLAPQLLNQAYVGEAGDFTDTFRHVHGGPFTLDTAVLNSTDVYRLEIDFNVSAEANTHGTVKVPMPAPGATAP